MKLKLLAFCALTSLSAISYAQQAKTLQSRIFEGYEETFYYYNDLNKIDSLHTYFTSNGSQEAYYLFDYDDKGMNTRQYTYQYWDGVYELRFWLDYTYTEEGQLKTRINYNYSDDLKEFFLSAKMEWEYKDGLIDKICSYFPSMTVPDGFDLFAEDRYEYKNGKLQTISTYTLPFGSSNLALTKKVEYTYDANGYLAEEYTSNYNNSGTVTSANRQVYKYDNNGNLIEFSKYSKNGYEPIMKYIYHYNTDIKRENVVLPSYFEDATQPHMIAMSTSTNIVELEEWWQVPMETDQLVHSGDYKWNYIGGETSINCMPQLNTAANFFIENATLYFLGLPEGQTVQLYDVNGALVEQTKYTENGISLNNLSKGVYLVRTNESVFRFVK